MTSLALLAYLCLYSACSSSQKNIAPADGQARFAQAEEAIARGDIRVGVRELVALRKSSGLAPSLRERTERQLIEVGYEEVEAYRDDPLALKRIFRSNYPERVRVRAGLFAADAYFRQDHPITAFEQLQWVDRTFPHHSERTLAGDILGRLGLHLIERKGRYSLIFSYSAKGTRALEYLVLRYPLDSRCDEAYFALSRFYEEDREIDYALERVEDLLVYHPGSPYAVAAQARLPYLRLLRLGRNDYDRSELAIAETEIQNWLQEHAGHELEPWVRELSRACAERLADNDITLARYYERIGSRDGQRLHARRALVTANRAALEGPAKVARALLDFGAEEGESLERGDDPGLPGDARIRRANALTDETPQASAAGGQTGAEQRQSPAEPNAPRNGTRGVQD